MKNENDAELATHVISFLLKSFKEYHQAKGTTSIIHVSKECVSVKSSGVGFVIT